jgi:acyl-CoA thioesterase I
MNHHTLIYMLLLSGLALGEEPKQSPAPAAAGEATAAKFVVVFGDSITAGGMLPASDKPQLWVNRVQRESGDYLQMENEGKGGRPTDSEKEFDAMVPRHDHVDVLVIALGTNDSRDLTPQCVPKAVAHLRAMIAKARATWGKDLRIVIASPPNIRKDALGPTKPIANEREAKLKELGAAFEKLAKELHCEFVNLFGVVPDASLSKDGVHPDAAGNEPIAKAMLEKLMVGKAKK